MHTYGGAGCERVREDDKLSPERRTQNVRSATMAAPSASVAVNNTGRMVLLFVLVWGCCLTGCLGALYRPVALSEIINSEDSRGVVRQISENEVDQRKLSPLVAAFSLSDKRLYGASRRRERRHDDRETSLKKLLEKLTRLQESRGTVEDSLTANHEDPQRTGRDSFADLLSVEALFPQTQSQDDSLSSLKHDPSVTAELQVIAQVDAIDNAQASFSDQRGKTHKQSQPTNILTPFDRSATVSHSRVPTLIAAYADDHGDFTKSKPDQTPTATNSDTVDGDETRLSDGYLSRDKYPKRYGIVLDKLPASASEYRMLSVKGTDRLADFNDNSDNSEDIPFKSVQTSAVVGSTGESTRPTGNAKPTRDDTSYTNQALLVDSLIHNTVKKMEGIIKKRVLNYNDILDSDSPEVPEDIDGLTGRAMNADGPDSKVHSRTYISASLEKAGIGNHLTSDNEAEYENKDNKRLWDTQRQYNHASDVTEAVMKAIASRTVPRDAQFWMNVSTYLDSKDYLSRTRRSPNRGRKRNGPHYVHLSITYGHVMPCEYKDRFYCMNGGTCVFVGALDIKTCR